MGRPPAGRNHARGIMTPKGRPDPGTLSINAMRYQFGGQVGKPVTARGTGVLVIDVGGTNIKLLATGRTTVGKIPSGPTLTPRRLVRLVRQSVDGWKYARVAIGYPGVVLHGKPIVEPKNLGRGWVGFDFAKAFGCPTRVVNDAAMQALGGYRGGRMLFLGLGTGLGSALIFEGLVVPLELAHLPYRKGRTYEDYVGKAGLELRGKKRWRMSVLDVVEKLKAALICDYVLLGGG